jgi:hypothetical protein
LVSVVQQCRRGFAIHCTVATDYTHILLQRSGVGVGEDVVQLRNDLSSVSFKCLLGNCPVCHSKQPSVLVEHGEGGEGGEDQTERIKLKRSLAGCALIARRARTPLKATMWEGQTLQRAFSSEADAGHLPLDPWRTFIAMMMSRGNRCRVSVRGSEMANKTIDLAYAIKDSQTERG